MKKIHFGTDILPHIVAVAVFLLITLFFFNPIFFENKTLQQYDIQQFIGSSKAIEDYREQSREEPLWTNAMFSGMPAYLISVQWGNQTIAFMKTLLAIFLPHPIANIFIAFICYYIMLICFRIRPYLAIAGAVAFGLSTYMTDWCDRFYAVGDGWHPPCLHKEACTWARCHRSSHGVAPS
jgi:hypothetical protein